MQLALYLGDVLIKYRKGAMIRSTKVEDPVFEEDPAKTNVLARCPNGKVRGRSTAPVYVVIRINLEDADNVDADVIGYSWDPDIGMPFIESIAARDCFGKWWNADKYGSAVYDPVRDDGTEAPVPPEKFMMWDEIEGDCDGMLTPTAASLTVYDMFRPETPDVRKPLRRYKLACAQLTIKDYVAIETDGDRKFL